jgi:2-phosphosulfolactate phosphatase
VGNRGRTPGTPAVIDVVATAEGVAAAGLRDATVLVVDVLRASTTIITALGNGCEAVVPVRDPDDARRRAGARDVLLAGERRGEPIPGFDLGNSPVEVTGERVRGKTVVFTTSNGTRALLAARGARAIGVAALVNLSAAADWARRGGGDVVIVCAGERGTRSLEDLVCAGLLAERLAGGIPGAVLTDAASEAVALARRYGAEVGRLREDSSWARHLASSGRAHDVAACLVLDTTALVPVMVGGVDKVVRGPR